MKCKTWHERQYRDPFIRERGVATLLTAVVLLVVVFLITYNISETVLSDKRNTAAATRGVEAFQRAQNGLDYAFSYVVSNSLSSVIQATSTSSVSLNYPGAGTVAITLNQNGETLEISSIGYSDDGVSIKRTVRDRISGSPTTSGQPNVPVVTKGGVNLTTGNIAVTNNVEPLTIWAGDAVDIGASVSTYISIDGVDNQLSNTATTRGPDIVDSDLNLKEATETEFLGAFFGVSGLADIGNTGSCTGDAVTTPRVCDDEDGDKYYYYDDGAVANSGACGDEPTARSLDLSSFNSTPDNPVQIVVNGAVDIKSGGGVPFYGVVVAQEASFSGGSGNKATINGSLVLLDCVDDTGSGGGSIILDSASIADLSGSGATVRVLGGWHDW